MACCIMSMLILAVQCAERYATDSLLRKSFSVILERYREYVQFVHENGPMCLFYIPTMQASYLPELDNFLSEFSL